MKIDTLTLLLIIISLIVIFYFLQSCNLICRTPEKYGQDASIRASSGWIAGPKNMYGYDPVDQFAQQITDMKNKKRAAYLKFMSDNPNNLEDSPTKNIGPRQSPKEMYYENHPPYFFKNCLGGCKPNETCINGECIPIPNKESFKYEEKEKEKLCFSCMSTDEIEAKGL